MIHHATSKFWRFYAELPKETQNLADKNFELLKVDSGHPSIHFKKVGRFWSARIGLHYRAIAIEEGTDMVWFWIGHHSAYDQIVGKSR